jgi:hypothetical protein
MAAMTVLSSVVVLDPESFAGEQPAKRASNERSGSVRRWVSFLMEAIVAEFVSPSIPNLRKWWSGCSGNYCG